MKKFLVVFFTLALFSAKASFAQFYQTDEGVTVVPEFEITADDNFGWEFVPSDDGYIMMSWYPSTPFPHGVAVSYNLIDQDNNETGGGAEQDQLSGLNALVDLPGFEWSDYKFVEIEWTSYDETGDYDDIAYSFYYNAPN